FTTWRSARPASCAATWRTRATRADAGKKLRLFFCMSLRAYRVPEDELEQVIRFVEGLDIRAIAERVMHALFEALAMRFEFSLQGITETEEHK
ncbi:MAG: hypothetical protein ACLS3C_11415, partial [Oscillospiraceae bacterium]